MAKDGIQDVEILAGATKVDSPVKGAIFRNLYIQDNAWNTRPGFGQMAQFDTTLGSPDVTEQPQGYTVHLGSKAMVTDFGHTQILTAHVNRSFTGEAGVMGIWTLVLSINIYDVTTNERHEEVLFRHTSENNPVVSPMPFWRGVYETASDLDLQSWSQAATASMFFTEFADSLFFGSPRLGIWVYTPADFSSNRRKQVNSTREHVWSLPYSESSLIVRISPVPGSSNFKYVGSGDFPNTPSAIATIDGRMVYAQGRTAWFSDQGQPGSISTQNDIQITADTDITAMHQAAGALLIFTATETYHYQPSIGDTVSNGRLQRLSPDIGCLSPTSICSVGEAVFWVDINGCYMSNGGLQITQVSEDLSPFFESHITDPLSQFVVASGLTTLDNEQPRLTYRLAPTRVSCVYDPKLKHVLVSVQDINLLLLYSVPNQSWSICPVESCASGTVAAPTPTVVGRQTNLPHPWVTVADQRVFLIAGVEEFLLTDEAAAETHDSTTGSYIITEWGRGGGLDRSVDALEDNRQFTGSYAFTVAGGVPHGEVLYGEPIKLPDDYQFPGGIAGSFAYPNGVIKSNCYLIPVQVRPDPTAAHPTALFCQFRFDNTHWRPVARADGGGIEVTLPPERAGSAEGWGIGILGPVAGVAECQVYNTATGLVDPLGNQVRATWSAATATARKAWSYAAMNLPQDHVSNVIFIPMELLDPANDTLASMGIIPTASATDAEDLDTWFFNKANVGTSLTHGNDDVAQPVDYAFKASQLGLEEVTRLLYRGCFVRMLTQGQASAPIFPDNPWGTFNVVVGSDWASWTSQVVSYTGTDYAIPAVDEVLNVEPIRTRQLNTVTDVGATRTFGNPLLLWGEVLNPGDGNYLIDEVEVDTMAISDAIKGEYVDVMVFGMIRSSAEALTLSSIKASLRAVIGGRRRVGRS